RLRLRDRRARELGRGPGPPRARRAGAARGHRAGVLAAAAVARHRGRRPRAPGRAARAPVRGRAHARGPPAERGRHRLRVLALAGEEQVTPDLILHTPIFRTRNFPLDPPDPRADALDMLSPDKVIVTCALTGAVTT